ncbi:DNA methyltransferase [Hydrogenovibrio sp. SC-1]|uniref:DNA adenine methylase n=1 Tax=Hydrogenovibrio sp. SC-1 TaxID=2065820 RepID=UPI000C7B15D2|nr:DNA adenine methylase [Hydrogenovibrio sp. SC-1]PLA73974.1 DNA methyltransferase [Hydrogenovibrio sp. SC-1]
MPITYSPLRYPGGKSQLTPFVIELLRENKLLDGVYIEPFAGGAGIAWHLLLKGYVQEVFINDLNPSIYAFWYSVLHKTDDLCGLIEKTPITIDEWHHQKYIQAMKNRSKLDLAFSTLFLNRTNRSGIIKAGVIGGKEQSGNYKLDCRFPKESIIKKIQDIALFKDEIQLSNLDANDFIKNKLTNVSEKSLVNIDPPYYVKGKGLYQNFFEHDDHVKLLDSIESISQPWIVTYDNTPEINALYQHYQPKSFELNYSAQKKCKGSEVLIYGPHLKQSPFRPGMSFKQIKQIRTKAKPA